jgi:hypothetical protein
LLVALVVVVGLPEVDVLLLLLLLFVEVLPLPVLVLVLVLVLAPVPPPSSSSPPQALTTKLPLRVAMASKLVSFFIVRILRPMGIRLEYGLASGPM